MFKGNQHVCSWLLIYSDEWFVLFFNTGEIVYCHLNLNEYESQWNLIKVWADIYNYKLYNNRYNSSRNHLLSTWRFTYVCLIVFNPTFNNISVISWRSVLLVEETGENHRPDASWWQTVSHNVIHLALIEIRTHIISGDRYWFHW
jgi:hypothetical protein